MTIQNIRIMADEVASLMAARFGGLKRGQYAVLEVMMRRRGAALPRRLRRDAMLLVKADQVADMPKLAKQQDFEALNRAHRNLTTYLKPLGHKGRMQDGALNLGATLVFALLVIAAVAIWMLVKRGIL